jgi:hypothetical protein
LEPLRGVHLGGSPIYVRGASHLDAYSRTWDNDLGSRRADPVVRCNKSDVLDLYANVIAGEILLGDALDYISKRRGFRNG